MVDSRETAKATIKAFATGNDALDRFVETYSVGEEGGWDLLLDVEGRYILVSPEGPVWAVVPSDGLSVEGDGPIALVKYTRIVDLLDPDMVYDPEVLGGYGSPGDAFDGFLRMEGMEFEPDGPAGPR